MIAAITTHNQYGKTSRAGQDTVIHKFDLDEEINTCYAHSVQDALDWLRKYPLYANATIDDLGDGRRLIVSPWMQRGFVDIVDDDPKMEGIDQFRHQVVVYPVNTIYENTSFRPG